MASILTWMVPSIKDIGKKTNSMGKGKKHGLMVLCMKVITFKGGSKVSEYSDGLMGQSMKANSTTITLKVRAGTVGQMEEPSQALGEGTRCMDQEFSPGMTEGNTKGNIKKTRSMDKAPSFGLMAENILESGLTENSMVKELSLLSTDNQEMENGATVKDFAGWMNE